MIARKTKGKRWPYGRLPRDWNHAVNYGANRQNRSLGRIDDGVECVDAIHSQVANGECATLKVGQPQLASLRTLDDLRTMARDTAEAQIIGARDDGYL